jgi:hypothetical protein
MLGCFWNIEWLEEDRNIRRMNDQSEWKGREEGQWENIPLFSRLVFGGDFGFGFLIVFEVVVKKGNKIRF